MLARLAPLVWLIALTGCAGPPESGSAVDDDVRPGAIEEASAAAEARSAGRLMRGRFTYMADAAIFENCGTGRRLPVAMAGDYAEAERAYLESRSNPGVPLLVSFEGRIGLRPPMEGDGLVDVVIIDRFVAVHPGEDCGSD
jgi:uncharacterized lipoprotein NlpE involved in copper resistance